MVNPAALADPAARVAAAEAFNQVKSIRYAACTKLTDWIRSGKTDVTYLNEHRYVAAFLRALTILAGVGTLGVGFAAMYFSAKVVSIGSSTALQSAQDRAIAAFARGVKDPNKVTQGVARVTYKNEAARAADVNAARVSEDLQNRAFEKLAQESFKLAFKPGAFKEVPQMIEAALEDVRTASQYKRLSTEISRKEFEEKYASFLYKKLMSEFVGAVVHTDPVQKAKALGGYDASPEGIMKDILEQAAALHRVNMDSLIDAFPGESTPEQVREMRAKLAAKLAAMGNDGQGVHFFRLLSEAVTEQTRRHGADSLIAEMKKNVDATFGKLAEEIDPAHFEALANAEKSLKTCVGTLEQLQPVNDVRRRLFGEMHETCRAALPEIAGETHPENYSIETIREKLTQALVDPLRKQLARCDKDSQEEIGGIERQIKFFEELIEAEIKKLEKGEADFMKQVAEAPEAHKGIETTSFAANLERIKAVASELEQLTAEVERLKAQDVHQGIQKQFDESKDLIEQFSLAHQFNRGMNGQTATRRSQQVDSEYDENDEKSSSAERGNSRSRVVSFNEGGATQAR